MNQVEKVVVDQSYLGEGWNSCKGVPGGCCATNCAMPDPRKIFSQFYIFSLESYPTLMMESLMQVLFQNF